MSKRQNHSLVSKLLDTTDTCVPSAELSSLLMMRRGVQISSRIFILVIIIVLIMMIMHADGSLDLCVYSSDDDVLDQTVRWCLSSSTVLRYTCNLLVLKNIYITKN